ncbi:MAG: hypothetical protein ACRBEQ_14215 [Hyphomonas sp.]
MQSLESFIEDCRAAIDQDPTHHTALAVVERAFENPDTVMNIVGKPTASGLTPLYQSDTLTIANLVWKPGMILAPHNHNMWAVIGIYTGREDNIFWRRLKDDPDGKLEAAGARSLSAGDVVPLGPDIIHSVANPLDRFTGAIHVYGGDFFGIERSEWDAETLTERPYDMEKVKALFSA